MNAPTCLPLPHRRFRLRHLGSHLGVDLGQQRRGTRRRHPDRTSQSIPVRVTGGPGIHRWHQRRRDFAAAMGTQRLGLELGQRRQRPAGRRAHQLSGNPAGQHDRGWQRNRPAGRGRRAHARAEVGRRCGGPGYNLYGQVGNGTTAKHIRPGTGHRPDHRHANCRGRRVQLRGPHRGVPAGVIATRPGAGGVTAPFAWQGAREAPRCISGAGCGSVLTTRPGLSGRGA
jgi:hypothetical protein